MGGPTLDAPATSTVRAVDPHAYRPLLAGRARGSAVVVILLAITVIAVLGMRYADQEAAGRLDLTLDTYIRDRFQRDNLITAGLVSLGNPAPAALLTAVVASAAAAARRWAGVVLTLGGTVTAVVITELILKPLIGRLRYGHLSFPSGHTTAVCSVAIAAVLMLATARRPGSAVLRLVASLIPVVVAGSVAIALVARHVHYATDTLAGCCVAAATVPALALVIDSLALHAQSRRSQKN
ncbi:MAG TPA: phosphatase PAP2 family protein [Pseudonocardiaceae bacterium]|nr:phosphatase PAP2 family protein [Pseudonocardiaceae bacterium]